MTHEDFVEKLIRVADGGAPVPGDGAMRIKNAIRPAWRAEVHARRRRLVGRAVAAMIAAAAVVWIAIVVVHEPESPGVRIAPKVARIERVRGGVDRPPRLMAGATIATQNDGRVALRLEGGQALRIDAATTLRLVSSTVVQLERGAIYIDSDGRSGIEVRSANAVVRDVGTQFQVRAGRDLEVRVRDGAVDVRSPRETKHIAAGSAMTVHADGSSQVATIAKSGADWRWTEEIAPPFEIEGRSVSDLLDWTARETGLRIRYARPDVEQLARTTILHGRLSESPPLDAAVAVLPVAGLDATRSGDSVVIHRR